LNPAYFAYWGKAKPAAADQAGWHLLPYHCLDVAAAGVIYLQKATHVRQLFQDRLKLSEKDLLDWVAFWLAIHDLGKSAKSRTATPSGMTA
jgi:CRISPR-associated endonuclease/helicase Cas3